VWVLFCVLLTVPASLILTDRTGRAVTEMNYHKIHVGIPLGQVERILGGPAPYPGEDLLPPPPRAGQHLIRIWRNIDETNYIEIEFDGDDLVYAKRFQLSNPTSLFKKILYFVRKTCGLN
jgi:hypothetical protein